MENFQVRDQCQSPLTVNVFYPYVIHINGEFCDGHHLHDVLLYMHQSFIHVLLLIRMSWLIITYRYLPINIDRADGHCTYHVK